MRIAIAAAVLAILVASAGQASAQCRMCGHPGPYGVYDSFRVKIFRGGSLEQIPDTEADAKPAEAEVATSPKKPSAAKASINLRKSTGPGPSAGKATEGEGDEALVPSSRRAITRQGDGALDPAPPDAFRLKTPPRGPAMGEAPPVPPPAVGQPGQAQLKPVDPAKGRIPKYRYSGSTYPYYFGRSYVNYPHWEQWHQPGTDTIRQNHKLKFLNTWFEPIWDFTHGVQTEESEEKAGGEVAEKPRAGTAR